MRCLVTGGAGYIGSAAVKALIKKDHEVIVVDNLSKGKKELIDEKAKFYNVDLADKEGLSKVFSENKIDVVVHFAAYKAVGESMQNAAKYSDNIIGTTNLLNLMVKNNVPKIIFSSSACVYGEAKEIPITEDSPIQKPDNYYGYTKMACEHMIKWYSKVHRIKYISLRYFNVAGDAGLHYIDPEAENVFPILIEALTGKREKFIVFGDDYNTRDGTCIRDYIDVNDLVEAHVLALSLDENNIINLGSSNGVSVMELVRLTEEVTGKKLNCEIGPRRKGDIAVSIASNEKAKKLMAWEPKRSIKEMIKSTYDAYFS